MSSVNHPRRTDAEFYVHSLQFAAGFFGVQFYQKNYYQLIEVEETGINNTLASYDRCPNANSAIGNFGTNQSALWAAQYTAPTIERLQPYISGVNLTAVDIIAMQQLCAYEVSHENMMSKPSAVVHNTIQSVALGFSEFCALFTESEWESFEYFIGALHSPQRSPV
jgi:Histidine phosphatase superfamily (branch 2)